MNFQHLIENIHRELTSVPQKGKVAAYIPELACIDPAKFGISLSPLNGAAYCVGDAREKFSIQSISKVFMLALVGPLLGSKIWERIDVEPSGNAFNSLVQLEYEKGIPRNPFINAGALVMADMMISELDQPAKALLALVRKLANNEHIFFNGKVAASEKIMGFKNIAMVNFLKSFGNIVNEVEQVLELYFLTCSLEMTCEDLARAFLCFANQGVVPHSGERILSPGQCKRLNALMLTCGFYDESGEFAFRVGLPGKSGVGGGIVAVMPEDYSIAVWNPRLNAKGNSELGMMTLELFTTQSGLSIF